MVFRTNNRDWLLAELLGCEFTELQMLENVGYGWTEILHDDWKSFFTKLCVKRMEVMRMGENIFRSQFGLNYLMGLVVRYGIEQMDNAVADRICELEAIPNERELDEDEETELNQLRMLNPFQDIRGICRGLDTHVWFEQNEDIYCRYFQNEMKTFEKGTGLRFEGTGSLGKRFLLD